MPSLDRPTRIGMIVPSSNTCLEPQTYRILGDRRDVTIHSTRIPVTRIALTSTPLSSRFLRHAAPKGSLPIAPAMATRTGPPWLARAVSKC